MCFLFVHCIINAIITLVSYVGDVQILACRQTHVWAWRQKLLEYVFIILRYQTLLIYC